MSKRISGTREWSVASVNCVTGCENDCRYCYARHEALTRYGGRIKSASEWPEAKVRDHDVAVVAEDLTDTDFNGLVADCPVCGATMRIQDKHIPNGWRAKIKWCDPI